MKYWLFAISVFFVSAAAAQRFTVSGHITDAETGESLIGATVHAGESNLGAVANAYGFYSVTLSGNSVALQFSYVGYIPFEVQLSLKSDTTLDAKLQASTMLEEVVVTSNKSTQELENARMGTINISMQQIKAVPAMMGENDVIKVLQMLPGVQAGTEGTSGLYVRGGGPDQNLILLDGVPVYNPSHLYGFFSTFNPDAINHVELVKGGFPARYGGRLSSVVDISMKEGNNQRLSGQGSLGIIASRVTIEGPIGKKTSFIASARRSYLNLLQSKQLAGRTEVDDGYRFHDLNAKINHKFNENNRVYLSAYKGADVAGFASDNKFTDALGQFSYHTVNESKLDWGNEIVAARWNHLFSKKIFSNLSATYSRYHFGLFSNTERDELDLATGVEENVFYTYNYQSGIEDVSTLFDVDFIPNPSHYIRAGVHGIHHTFTPGVLALTSSEEALAREANTTRIAADELSAYLEDDWDLNARIKINAGIHAAAFLVDNTTYASLQPRVAVRWLVGSDWAIKSSYARMQQFVHLLTNAGIGLPTDLWVPATGRIKPQESQQVSLSLTRVLAGYEFVLENYFKEMVNVIEYKDGASYLSANQDWQDKVEMGRGESYGSELFVKKNVGKVTGWLGYTLSWTNRQFDNLNEGRWFPYRYDRRHDIKVVGMYQWNAKLDLSASWVFATGNAVTLPLDMYFGSYTFRGGIGGSGLEHVVEHYDARNNYRVKPYHRADLSVNYLLRKKRFEQRLNFSVYNFYNRRNPFYLEFIYTDKGQRVLRQATLFQAMPSISYSIKF